MHGESWALRIPQRLHTCSASVQSFPYSGLPAGVTCRPSWSVAAHPQLRCCECASLRILLGWHSAPSSHEDPPSLTQCPPRAGSFLTLHQDPRPDAVLPHMPPRAETKPALCVSEIARTPTPPETHNVGFVTCVLSRSPSSRPLLPGLLHTSALAPSKGPQWVREFLTHPLPPGMAVRASQAIVTAVCLRRFAQVPPNAWHR